MTPRSPTGSPAMLALVCSLLLTGCGPGFQPRNGPGLNTPVPDAPPPGEDVVNTPFVLGIENVPHQRMDAVARTLPALRKAGFDLFGRNNVKWSDFEPTPPKGGKPQRDFSRLDREFKVYADAGAQIQVTFLCRSPWATVIPESKLTAEIAGSPPKDAHWDAWADAVEAFVERYDGDGRDDAFRLKRPLIRILTIQEEVEFPDHWSKHGGSAADYGRLLDAAYEGAKRADKTILVARAGASVGTLFDLDPTVAEVDRAARKMGWAAEAFAFMKESLANPVRYDLFSLHLNRSSTGLVPYVRFVRERMEASGTVRPLMIDDAASVNSVRRGEPSLSAESKRALALKPGPTMLRHQVGHALRVAALARAVDLRAVLFTGYTDIPSSPYTQIKHGGFIDSAKFLRGAKAEDCVRPVVPALQRLLACIDAASDVSLVEEGDIGVGPDAKACIVAFEHARRPAYLVWAHDRDTSVSLDLPGRQATVWTLGSEPREPYESSTRAVTKGTLRLEVGHVPVFVEAR